MRLRDKILYHLIKGRLAENRRFKDLHKGESCYVFGNGVSLKNMNLKAFNDRISIGCNALFLHKEFNRLDCRYYQIPASVFFYPYRRYYGKMHRNYLNDLSRTKIRQFNNVHFFTSITNRLNMRAGNVSYTHHFGAASPNLECCEMDGIFSFMSGGLRAMLGTAIYMGFENVTLVGCDYLFSPGQRTHFFEKGPGINDGDPGTGDISFFEMCRKKMMVNIITPDGLESKVLPYIPYSEYEKAAPESRENTDIVDAESLGHLNKLGFYRIF